MQVPPRESLLYDKENKQCVEDWRSRYTSLADWYSATLQRQVDDRKPIPVGLIACACYMILIDPDTSVCIRYQPASSERVLDCKYEQPDARRSRWREIERRREVTDKTHLVPMTSFEVSYRRRLLPPESGTWFLGLLTRLNVTMHFCRCA